MGLEMGFAIGDAIDWKGLEMGLEMGSIGDRIDWKGLDMGLEMGFAIANEMNWRWDRRWDRLEGIGDKLEIRGR